MQSGIVCPVVEVENDDRSEINDVWWTGEKKNTWISSFEFSITKGCLPFSYIAAIIEVETHSWETCSFYPPDKKNTTGFYWKQQMSNTLYDSHGHRQFRFALPEQHTCSKDSWFCLSRSFQIKLHNVWQNYIQTVRLKVSHVLSYVKKRESDCYLYFI